MKFITELKSNIHKLQNIEGLLLRILNVANMKYAMHISVLAIVELWRESLAMKRLRFL